MILQQLFALICARAGEILGFEVNRVDKIVLCFEKKKNKVTREFQAILDEPRNNLRLIISITDIFFKAECRRLVLFPGCYYTFFACMFCFPISDHVMVL